MFDNLPCAKTGQKVIAALRRRQQKQAAKTEESAVLLCCWTHENYSPGAKRAAEKNPDLRLCVYCDQVKI